MGSIEKIIAQSFLKMAEGLETGAFMDRPKIALTGMGSEHGEENAMAAAKMAAKRGVDVYYIGTLTAEGVTTIPVANDEEGHKKMEEMLNNHEVDGAVTMHYPFPIGVSTVGRAITPAKGREMFIANTTGTSSSDRIEGMIKNAVSGIITAKACGVGNPTVGILNVDGARQTEMALNQLKANGYEFTWAESARADSGAVMRGNVLVKMLAAFTTGGSFESTGFGYGPGIGKGYDKLILIISRASGAPLIANALEYAAELVKGKVFEKASAEFAKAEKAGLNQILEARKAAAKPAAAEEKVVKPAAEPCTASIAGIEVMDLEDAAQALWKEGIYAETGMGCTGPLVMMSEANHARALEILKKAGYVG